MKKINKYTLILLLLVFAAISCQNDDFLNELPRDIMTADNLYLTPSGFENGLNGILSIVRSERYRGSGFHGTKAWLAKGSTDDYYSSRYGSMGYFYVQWGDHMNPLTPAVETFWEWNYSIINSCNTVIDRAENPDIKWESAAQKNEIVGTARLIRAWAYRHLVSLWGDVLLVLQESSGTNIKTDWSRESKSNIYIEMEKDLLFAEQHLPDVHSRLGYLSKVVAQHYLAELYLAMNEPDKAEQKALAAINNPNYSLITERYGIKADQPGVPFMDQFYQGNTFYSQGNTEVLWEFPFDRDIIGGGANVMRRSWMIRYSAIAGVSVNPEWGRGSDFYAVTKHAWDLYEEGDDRNSEYAVYWYVVSDAGDTIRMTTEGKQEPERDKYWPSTRKWADGDPDNPSSSDGYHDQPYLRLAETYLLLAEAQYLNGKTSEAAETLNIIRRRSNASEISASDVDIDFILDERTRELLTEEHRRHTLLRLNKWIERTKAFNSQSANFITERDKLLPIPQSVIDANLDTEMSQNPGYN